MTGPGAPRRRASDHHVHPEYWTEADHNRFEDRLANEIEKVRREANARMDRMSDQIDGLNRNLLLIAGGLGLLAFLLPIIAPFIRTLFGGF